MIFLLFICSATSAFAQTSIGQALPAVIDATHHLITGDWKQKSPVDRITGTCTFSRGSVIRLVDTQGRILSEQTLVKNEFTFYGVTPGTYTIDAEDRISKSTVHIEGIRNGAVLELSSTGSSTRPVYTE